MSRGTVHIDAPRDHRRVAGPLHFTAGQHTPCQSPCQLCLTFQLACARLTFHMLPQPTEDDATQEPCFVAAVHLAFSLHQSIHVLHVRPIRFDRRVPTWIVHLFAFVHYTSTRPRVFFITFQCTSVAQGAFFIAAHFCNLPRCLQSHKLFPSVVMEQSLAQHCHMQRLLAPPHFAQLWMSRCSDIFFVYMAREERLLGQQVWVRRRGRQKHWRGR